MDVNTFKLFEILVKINDSPENHYSTNKIDRGKVREWSIYAEDQKCSMGGGRGSTMLRLVPTEVVLLGSRFTLPLQSVGLRGVYPRLSSSSIKRPVIPWTQFKLGI